MCPQQRADNDICYTTCTLLCSLDHLRDCRVFRARRSTRYCGEPAARSPPWSAATACVSLRKAWASSRRRAFGAREVFEASGELRDRASTGVNAAWESRLGSGCGDRSCRALKTPSVRSPGCNGKSTHLVVLAKHVLRRVHCASPDCQHSPRQLTSGYNVPIVLFGSENIQSAVGKRLSCKPGGVACAFSASSFRTTSSYGTRVYLEGPEGAFGSPAGPNIFTFAMDVLSAQTHLLRRCAV